MTQSQVGGMQRAPWVVPRVEVLPRLTELTLVTGGGIPGEGSVGTGSTVIG